MTVSASYKSFLAELLAGMGPVQIRSMFGGGGVFLDGVMFALIADETLYLKADHSTTDAFEAEGMAPFAYDKKGKAAVMSYWQIPDRLLDDPDELVCWARDALAIAAAKKRPKQR